MLAMPLGSMKQFARDGKIKKHERESDGEKRKRRSQRAASPKTNGFILEPPAEALPLEAGRGGVTQW